MSGSTHNDPFTRKGSGLGAETNYGGGIQGGISNEEPIVFRIAFNRWDWRRPVATIRVS